MGPGDTDVDTLLKELFGVRLPLPGGPGQPARGSVPPPPPPPLAPEYLLSPDEREILRLERVQEALEKENRKLIGQIKDHEEQIQLRDEENRQILGEYIAAKTQLNQLLNAITTPKD